MVQSHAAAWCIPSSEVDTMMALLDAFNAAFDAHDAAETRNRITGKADKLARNALAAQVRHIKRGYIVPGLENHRITEDQYQELGLALHAKTATSFTHITSRAAFRWRDCGVKHTTFPINKGGHASFAHPAEHHVAFQIADSRPPFDDFRSVVDAVVRLNGA
jgi:hypothetical protein